jgi:hypothetical protein
MSEEHTPESTQAVQASVQAAKPVSLPDSALNFLKDLDNAIKSTLESNTMLHLYQDSFKNTTDRHFQEFPWPPFETFEETLEKKKEEISKYLPIYMSITISYPLTIFLSLPLSIYLSIYSYQIH